MPNLFSEQSSGKDLQELVNQLVKGSPDQKEEFIYGLYDTSNKSIFARVNDFFINHSRIALKEKAYFFYLLGVLLNAGLPMVNSLKLLSRRTPNVRFSRVINTLAYLIDRGNRLSSSMERFPDVFDEAMIGVVHAGETVGHLDTMLFRIAKQLEATYAINLKIRSAFIYPALVLLTLFLTGSVIVTYVIPQLAEFFIQSNATLPFLTQALIFISVLFRSYWWLLLASFLVLFLITVLYLQTDIGRLKWDYHTLRFPFYGHLIRKVIVSKFVRLLGVLLEAGISLPHAMDIIARSMTNEVYRRTIFQVKSHIQAGGRISASLKQAPFLFPEIVVHMLALGENSASLDEMCVKIAHHYDLEVDYSLKNLISVLEPLAIIVVAFAVIFVAFAIMGPIFSLTDLV